MWSQHPRAFSRTWAKAQEWPLHKVRRTGPYKAIFPAAPPLFACLREKEQGERCEMTSSRMLMCTCLSWRRHPMARPSVVRPARDLGKKLQNRPICHRHLVLLTGQGRVTLRAGEGRPCPGRCWQQLVVNAACKMLPFWAFACIWKRSVFLRAPLLATGFSL